ncbi:MAG TPA: hypothetical protein VFB41_09020 [Solirubrobacteraceae bacterium]|nr:hypothetical protein [Solirubrobacteraceae bacterium]
MRALAAAIVAVALSAAFATVAGAATSSGYCARNVKLGRGTVDRRVNGVTVWHRGVVVHACSDRFRRAYALMIVDSKARVSLVRASKQRCVAIALTRTGKLPQILFKDLAGKDVGTSVQVVGFGAASASIGSLAVSANCAAAWGQTVVDAAGTTTSSIVAKGFGAATALTSAVSEIAIVASAADTTNVAMLAAGRGVTVSWKQSGVRQAASLP